MAYLQERDAVTEHSDEQLNSPTQFPTIGDGTNAADQTDLSVNEDDRNPTPQLDKSDSLGKLTYSGSAGANAYSTMAEAIDKVQATVVEISTETMVSGGWLGNYVSSGAGSGVVISEDGYIVTNNHVIADADTITVRMTDGSEYSAVLIGRDVATDIAVIWVDTKGVSLQAAQLGCSADLIVGEWVFAIGNPLGSLGGTVTNGIISATARGIVIDGQKMTLLQTNAAVNPGNSGGGLFNMAGQLIGVVNAKCSEDDVEGLGFAIPVDTAYEVISQLIEYGYVRGVVDHGLSLYDITSANIMTAWRYFNSSYAGVYILESAHTDELKYGDLLYAIDGVKVASSKEVEAVLAGYEIGDTVTLTVVRAETEYQVELTLKEYVPSDLNVQFTPQ
jgi:serine protease Do